MDTTAVCTSQFKKKTTSVATTHQKSEVNDKICISLYYATMLPQCLQQLLAYTSSNSSKSGMQQRQNVLLTEMEMEEDKKNPENGGPGAKEGPPWGPGVMPLTGVKEQSPLMLKAFF